MELLLLCRAGFEKEVAAEISDVTAERGLQGYVNTKAGDGFVRFIAFDDGALEQLIQSVDFKQLVFIRQWSLTHGPQEDLPQGDRVAPLLETALGLPAANKLVVEPPDTNEGKSLATLARGVGRHLEKALRGAGHWRKNSDWQLQLVFTSGSSGFVGVTPVKNSAQWPAGVPRLRLPRAAPSRATLKLEEAWHHFVPNQEWALRLAPGMKAVDLGAAPGGWTWQLVNKSMWVDAVDNGPMHPELMDSGVVKHHETDGFRYSPTKPVDWLVCDIADKPARVAANIARWGANGWCKEAIFNLKLPMKQRYQAVQDCQFLIENVLAEAGVEPLELHFKQLYHDREEVTGHLRLA